MRTVPDDNAVVRLVTKTKERSEGCVETLRNMLALAEDGQLVGVAVAGFDLEGYAHSAYEAGDNSVLLVGAIERVKFRVLQMQEEA